MKIRYKVEEESVMWIEFNSMQQSQYFYVCIFACVTLSQWVTLPGHTGQVGQHVVKLSVCDLSECGEFWEHDDGAAIISSTS